jgi:hypothetical protein
MPNSSSEFVIEFSGVEKNIIVDHLSQRLPGRPVFVYDSSLVVELRDGLG